MVVNRIAKLYIQPIFCTEQLKVRYAEALIRPVNRDKTVADILRYIENNNLHLELDLFVLQEACKFIRRRKALFNITMNMSKGSLETPGYYRMLIRVLKTNSVSIRRIVFEVHETTDYLNEAVKENIQGIVANGGKVAMDDFGCYNATIDNLLKHSITMVKFDRSFILNTSIDNLKYLSNIVVVMNRLGIDTVIEGVETKEQLKLASEIGYRYIQGFLLAKPMNVEYCRR